MLSLAARGLLAITATLLIVCTVGLAILYHRGERLLSVKRADPRLGLQSGDAAIVRTPGRPAVVLPGFGRWLDVLSRPPVLAAAVYLPAGLIAAAETRRLADIYARPFYSVRL